MSSRSQRQEHARQTRAVLESACYQAETAPGEQQHIDIRELLDASCAGTTMHPAEAPPAAGPPEEHHGTRIDVTAETTLEAGRRLHDELGSEAAASLCLLNFASAKNPGGGFENGAQAQEESLARASGLVACLELHQADFYDPHRRDPSDGLYSHAMIHSPSVPFFREDSGRFCSPWCASVITSPAPNAGVASPKCGSRAVSEALAERCRRVLLLALQRRHQDLVLGAFGCGVFKNDPREVAAIFGSLLGSSGEFHGAFRRIVFAVPGGFADVNHRAFVERFGEAQAEARAPPSGRRGGKAERRSKRWAKHAGDP